jgi:hypothetical protein
MDRGRRGAGGIAAIAVLVLLLATLATAKGGDARLYPPKPGDGVAIFLVDNGFHSDLVLPRQAILADAGPMASAVTQTTADPWVMVGWGDARFYQDASPWQGRVLDGLRALLGGRPTVVHLEGVYASPDRVWRSGAHRIVVSRAGLGALIRRADLAFRPGPGPTLAARGVGDEAFFASSEAFSLFHLCNHWTAELLNAAGLPVTPALDTAPAGLWLDLQLRAGL